jgi:hypothetical protein
VPKPGTNEWWTLWWNCSNAGISSECSQTLRTDWDELARCGLDEVPMRRNIGDDQVRWISDAGTASAAIEIDATTQIESRYRMLRGLLTLMTPVTVTPSSSTI